MLTRKQKEQLVEELSDVFEKSSLILFSDYKGLNVEQITKLRRNLREKLANGARYRVIKNSVAYLALKKAGYNVEEIEDVFSGPLAILYVEDGDPIEAIKIIYDFSKEMKGLPSFKGLYLDGKFFGADEVENLSKLPSKEQLLAMVVSGVQGPIRGFVNVLSGTLKSLLYALNAIKDKKSE
ncbi:MULTISPECIES: 50S ribosomal protein L10 [unclassified Thermosipho (in: thermotogales)]|uniref:50S ribosomal protein L10 n=1 Tax=unclassified Thermosipho (in: thermotogales) TaxID=2676525 RepID=UPI0009878399|nr:MULTISPECIES: 50S ribosomal protein L10 [unclassified Thermosipho (in: thermotogales)]MBT1248119.1 50S ribosomal protein L10 [Thermosipho sp. 1244]OOC46706.1 50S ribosomal protein L10 [Thermosipho sp. 1223]